VGVLERRLTDRRQPGELPPDRDRVPMRWRCRVGLGQPAKIVQSLCLGFHLPGCLAPVRIRSDHQNEVSELGWRTPGAICWWPDRRQPRTCGDEIGSWLSSLPWRCGAAWRRRTGPKLSGCFAEIGSWLWSLPRRCGAAWRRQTGPKLSGCFDECWPSRSRPWSQPPGDLWSRRPPSVPEPRWRPSRPQPRCLRRCCEAARPRGSARRPSSALWTVFGCAF